MLRSEVRAALKDVTANADGRWECIQPGCTTTYSAKTDLAVHIKQKHCLDAVVYKCTHDGCAHTTTNKSSFKLHLKQHADKLQCPHCDYKTALKQTLQRHIKIQHGDAEEFHCVHAHCEYKTKYIDNLRRHIKTCTADGVIYPCELCDVEAFSTRRELIKHGQEAHGAATHRCPECAQPFSTKSGLERHIREVDCKGL